MFHHLSEEGQLFDEDGQWRTDLRVEDLEVPEGVRLVIGRRVKRLSTEARRVLTTAATVGRSFDLGLLEALGDAVGEALLTVLEEAEAAKLILAVSSLREARWEFAHGLIRQTLGSSLSLPRRQRTHLRVAEAMERVYGAAADRHASDLAHHLYLAGALADLGKTVRFLSLAGDRAVEAVALDEARSHYHQAIQLLDEMEEGEETSRLHADIVLKWAAVSHYAATRKNIETLEAALASARALHDSKRVARLTYWLGRLHYMMGNPSEASTQLSLCIELAEELDDEETIALSYNLRGRVCYQTAEFPLGIDLLRKGILMMERRGDDEEAAYSTSILGVTLCLVGAFAEGFEQHERALQRFRRHDNEVGESAALNRLGMCQALHGSWDEALETSANAARTAESFGNTLVVGMATATHGYADAMSGKVAEGIPRIREGIRMIESSGSTLGFSLFYAWLAEAAVLARSGPVAERYAEKALEFARAGNRWGEVASMRALAVASAQQAAPNWGAVETQLNASLELARARVDSGPTWRSAYIGTASSWAAEGTARKRESRFCRRPSSSLRWK